MKNKQKPGDKQHGKGIRQLSVKDEKGYLEGKAEMVRAAESWY